MPRYATHQPGSGIMHYTAQRIAIRTSVGAILLIFDAGGRNKCRTS
jgi:hypothetical protein